MAQSAGLCNGTNAIVYDFMFVSSNDLPIVLVQVTDPYIGPSLLDEVPNIVPIAPKDISWGKTSSDLRVVRRGIPLRLAYAMTVHKVQGLTCSYVVFHSNAIPNISFVYVALSRVTHRNSIVITQPLTLERLTATPEQIALFQGEEQRVLKAVAQTTRAASPSVSRMKAVAQAHNAAFTPR
ncbi:Vacuolar protein sorting-associated protein 27 [Phytophthora nicotianae]|nr:Vacuolar protein sorting-associated protein 27 [Phytophthora nicotianae]